MSLGQLSSNIVHHVFSTVNGAFAWPPSSKVAGTAFFTAAQVLAFYLFATVDNFSFPITTSYLSLRGRVQVENPDIQLIEQIFFNALLRTELAIDDRIRGNRDRPERHTHYHNMRDIIPCPPCSGYPRLGIFPCYPLFIRLIKPTLQFGYQLYRSVKDLVFNYFEVESTGRIDDIAVFDLGQIIGAGFIEGPRHGAALQWLLSDALVWRWQAKGKRLFFDIKINDLPANSLRVVFRGGRVERFDN
ncbi:uncharacterized protein B0T23DRAFT_206919 [Neurospora hispaniola]|uniref:Uncharacterized protein n=1 Tax=Neurospora hispaniola TaxID=588809 RepID=A0AAJ0MN49_9PEZI|nr:hypothetical protein B0T23DRAFT_206919 [Neurospora hispaniola]